MTVTSTATGTVLITGATGFLGGHLVDGCLREGHRVRALVRPGSDTARLRSLPGVDLVPGDLADAASLRRAAEGCDTVLHSAARVVDHGTRAQFQQANVTGTRLLLSAARAAGAGRFVFVSSPSALMRLREGDRLGVDESTPYPERFFNHYCATKAAAEREVLASGGAGFTTVAVRPRGIWGPRDQAGFLPRLTAAMRAGRLPDLSGGKRVLVSLCHVDNAVHACLRAAAAPAERVSGKAYFVADREVTDLWAFLARVADLAGCAPPGPRIPLPVSRALAATAETLWRLRPGPPVSTPPLTRYMLALLTRSTTYDTTAAHQDLAYDPPRTQQSGLRTLFAPAPETTNASPHPTAPAGTSADAPAGTRTTDADADAASGAAGSRPTARAGTPADAVTDAGTCPTASATASAGTRAEADAGPRPTGPAGARADATEPAAAPRPTAFAEALPLIP
ncbi:NAD-dependent epimerase/dehydratase family protein, partial [Streptomyces bambusae]|uniref:NAD-dependent epimerase/dehydratase family protein n=1 Tax=Streptomyces bambusae TaxID=1550616 RepID=UPI0027DFDD1C